MDEILSKKIIVDRYNVSRETFSRLEEYERLLVKWQKALNIVSRETLEHFWCRHILDSLQISRYLVKTNSNILDVGSGGGFPGMVLAIYDKNLKITCVDSDTRKSIFLQEAAMKTKTTNVTVLNARVETITDKFDIIMARGFSSLVNLISITSKLAPKGIFLKGKKLNQEIAEAKKEYDFKFNIFESETSDSGKIIAIDEIKHKTY